MRTILYVILVVIQLTTAIIAYHAKQDVRTLGAVVEQQTLVMDQMAGAMVDMKEELDRRTTGEYLWKTQFDWIEGRK